MVVCFSGCKMIYIYMVNDGANVYMYTGLNPLRTNLSKA